MAQSNLHPISESSLPDKNPITLKTLLKWFLVIGLWIISVAFTATLFKGEPIGILSLLSLIADILGISTGLLGIYFYFQSDRLNQIIGSQTQEIDLIVNRLEGRMWGAFEQVIVRGEPNLEKVSQAIRKINEKLDKQDVPNETKVEMEEDLSLLQKYIDRLENWQRQPMGSQPFSIFFERHNPVLENLERLRAQASLQIVSEQDFKDFLLSLIKNKTISLLELPYYAQRLCFTVEMGDGNEIAIKLI